MSWAEGSGTERTCWFNEFLCCNCQPHSGANPRLFIEKSALGKMSDEVFFSAGIIVRLSGLFFLFFGSDLPCEGPGGPETTTHDI